MSISDARTALEQAMTCHQHGEFSAAERHYARTLELQPDNLQALRLRAVLARDLGNVGLALRLLARAVELAPDYNAAHIEIGMTHTLRGDLQAADDALRRARQLTPNDIDLLTHLAALLQHRGHLHEAISLYREVLEQDASEVEIRGNLAKALADSGQHDAALQEADTAVQLADGARGSLAVRGAVLIDAGRYSDARESLLAALDNLTDGVTDEMALVNLALCCNELGDQPTALEWLARAVEMNPHNARAVADLTNALSAAGEDDSALALAGDFLARHPGERLVVGALAQALRNAGQQTEADALVDCDSLITVVDLPLPSDIAADIAADSNFHATLAKEILADPSLLQDPVGKATTGGAQTGELDLRASPAKRAFAALMQTAVSDAIADYRARGFDTHPLMQTATDEWTLRAWGTVLPAGGRQVPHMHPLGWLSAVYYVAVPDGIGDSTEDGWLEFGRPPDRAWQKSTPPTRRIEPRPGRLVIFPSWFWHRTLPFDNEGEAAAATASRISIAFDVMPLA